MYVVEFCNVSTPDAVHASTDNCIVYSNGSFKGTVQYSTFDSLNTAHLNERLEYVIERHFVFDLKEEF